MMPFYELLRLSMGPMMPFHELLRPSVGPDVSRPSPIYRPVRKPPHAQINWLKLIIAPRWIFRYPGLIINLHLLDVYCSINPATLPLMRRNSSVNKHHSQHAILNLWKQVGQWVSRNTIPAGENGVGNIRIQVGKSL